MQKNFFRAVFVAAILLFSFTAFADESSVKLYSKDEYKSLADGPQLVIGLGVVTDFGTLPFSTESGITKDVMKKAAKIGATGMHVTGKSQKKGDNGWGLSGYQLHITAEAFKFEEPTLDNIRSAIHNKRSISWVATKSAVNLALAAGYVQLADDLLDEILHGGKGAIKNVMVNGYAKLKGQDSTPGLLQVVETPGMAESIVDAALKELPPDVRGQAVYKRIVNAPDKTATRLVVDYAAEASASDIPNLQKLFQLHASDTVRAEAGKALVRLGDTAFLKEALGAERSPEVSKAVKKEMLRN